MARPSTVGLRIAWRVLRPRHGVAVAAPVAAPAPPAPESPLFESWRTDLDDLADLAARFADPADAATAARRRAAFSADAVARRLTAAVESGDGD